MGFHDVNSRFCPANSQLYLAVVKPSGGNRLRIVAHVHYPCRGGNENDQPVATWTLVGASKTQRELTMAAAKHFLNHIPREVCAKCLGGGCKECDFFGTTTAAPYRLPKLNRGPTK